MVLYAHIVAIGNWNTLSFVKHLYAHNDARQGIINKRKELAIKLELANMKWF